MLHSAVTGIANKEIIKTLLAKNPYLVMIKDASGLTPSYYNTSKEILEILQNCERDIIDRLNIEPWHGWAEDKIFRDDMSIIGNNKHTIMELV
ncbi:MULTISPECIES: hypothetical protein [spotted fever group]|uniref:Ankyrin repeat n=2 Tax=Rickettsia rickettsii TaxID=783 RepID=A0A0H3AVH7_RICRS|nr:MULTISPECIES: hypothetical protein [spotted fever group]ABV75849.1 hypothetical protein A1G_01345 [Rickettsia rickettsii str. 'Sheila Smith']AFB22586.1 hypothetical protein RPN_05565 [Rickettsia rickettsii str. Brazil]AFB23178.1 hypothetical protein RPL_01335 [Rickettsia rickettsii str. Colombia]AFB24529.1 hypothetical protein RPO_01340 [Rickettsia rickettsii str. Arizona]AFB27215.1 hypothetical protein RPJ_01325 [Rickettsia rickettsii str. Hino]